jgi:alpha-amylase
LMLNLPCRLALVYGKDYFPSSVWPGAYGLKPIIDNIAWFARTFAFGNWERRWVDQDVYAYTRDGNGGSVGWSGGCLVAANFNTLNLRTITVQTMWAPGTWIHDYSGHCTDATVGGNGYVTITLPSNAFSRGVSFGLFAPGGVNHPVRNPPMTTTQIFKGEQGEDIPALHEGAFVLPQRIYCSSGTTVEAALTIDPSDMTKSSSIDFSLHEPSGAEVASGSIGSGSHVATISGKTGEDGWHSLTLTGRGVAADGVKFSLSVKYRGLA